MKQEDIDFLVDLQRELRTQTNDGNAEPVYWGIIEKKWIPCPDGCGNSFIYTSSECKLMSLPEFLDYIEENEYISDSGVEDLWSQVDKNNIQEVVDFANDTLSLSDVRVVDQTLEDVITWDTGCFLTKRAAKEYIKRFGYNHSNPHPFAMTAYRNFELQRFLELFKEMDLNKLKDKENEKI